MINLNALTDTLASESMFKFNSIEPPFHFFIISPDSFFMACNDLQAKNFGFNTHSDIIGLHIFDIIRETQASHQLIENNKRVLIDNKKMVFFERSTSKNSTEITGLSYKQPLKNNHNKPCGTVGIAFLIDNKESLFSDGHSEIALSNRQIDCLYYLTKGMTSKQIAQRLQLSPRTVEHHFEAIKEKLNCHSRTDLVEKAHQVTAIKQRILFDYLSS